MGNFEIYTADDEEPDCNRCKHCCDDFLCDERCGEENGWAGYERVELEESEDCSCHYTKLNQFHTAEQKEAEGFRGLMENIR